MSLIFDKTVTVLIARIYYKENYLKLYSLKKTPDLFPEEEDEAK